MRHLPKLDAGPAGQVRLPGQEHERPVDPRSILAWVGNRHGPMGGGRPGGLRESNHAEQVLAVLGAREAVGPDPRASVAQ
jgi:hypothetical protein